jgi:hypothetical protein
MAGYDRKHQARQQGSSKRLQNSDGSNIIVKGL